jgi:hypothetical protein
MEQFSVCTRKRILYQGPGTYLSLPYVMEPRAPRLVAHEAVGGA